jgi:hypothetical protein
MTAATGKSHFDKLSVTLYPTQRVGIFDVCIAAHAQGPSEGKPARGGPPGRELQLPFGFSSTFGGVTSTGNSSIRDHSSNDPSYTRTL